jgi:hypothetical protein
MTTETPRTDALMRPNGALATNLLEHARQLERELNASKAEVKRLRDLLKRAIKIAKTLSGGGSRACRELHHPKKDMHEIGTVCPVEEKLEKAVSNLEKLKTETRFATRSELY